MTHYHLPTLRIVLAAWLLSLAAPSPCEEGAAPAGAAPIAATPTPTRRFNLPTGPERRGLEPAGRLSHPAIEEASGLVESRQWPGTFWTHNDSGDSPRLFAVDARGSIHRPEWVKEENYEGLAIAAAAHIDWEDIATDDDGNLYVGDVGNNENMRRDLTVYVVREPHPMMAASALAVEAIEVAYPDQDGFPPSERNFDCESLFWADGKLHFVTKHRSDTNAKLYRLDAIKPATRNPLTLLGEVDLRSAATAADVLPDGSAIAVLTYDSIWLFERPADGSGNYFAGPARWLPTAGGKQCEAICFADGGESLIVANEQRDMYLVPVADLVPLSE